MIAKRLHIQKSKKRKAAFHSTINTSFVTVENIENK